MAASCKTTGESAPLDCYSSSSSDVGDKLFSHRLCTFTGTSLVEVMKIKALKLDDLPLPQATNTQVTYRSRCGASTKDCRVGDYVLSLIPPEFNCSEVLVAVDLELDKFKTDLRPFIKPVTNRPDVAVLRQGLPLVLVEVELSSYRTAICKEITGVIDQLRLLRNYDSSISKCIGFVFPAFESYQCVTMVTVEWKDLSFCVRCSALTTWPDVNREVSEVITTFLTISCHINQGVSPLRFFVRLSEDDLRAVGSKVDDTIECQVASRQSIVLRGASHFWKWIGNTSERDSMKDLIIRDHRLFPYKPISVTDELFFVGVPRYKNPLTRKEASDCLYSLVEKIGAVLVDLHSEGVAHLDVRLDNICFTDTDDVVMIDFDRYKPSSSSAAFASSVYINSEMYQCKDGWTCGQLDFKQLGLVILWVLSGHNCHQESIPDLNDQFLNDLLFEG